MFSQKEIEFMEHWELVREKESHFLSKLGRGLPMAMLFGLPIILSIVCVYYLSPEWYTKISQAASGVLGTLILAVIITIIFFSYFRMHFKWEMNEQLYMELKSRQQNSNTA
jgi:glycopeptide antibiotics resistance protein